MNYNLGYAYYLTGKLPDADHYLSRATQIDASRPDAFFYLGLTKLKRGDINAAAADVQRAVIIRPDADHYHFALGVILKLQGNLPGALSRKSVRRLDLDPSQSFRPPAGRSDCSGAGSRRKTLTRAFRQIAQAIILALLPCASALAQTTSPYGIFTPRRRSPMD